MLDGGGGMVGGSQSDWLPEPGQEIILAVTQWVRNLDLRRQRRCTSIAKLGINSCSRAVTGMPEGRQTCAVQVDFAVQLAQCSITPCKSHPDMRSTHAR